MATDESNLPTEDEVIEYFNSMKFCCIRCGSKDIEVSGPRTHVHEQEPRRIQILEDVFWNGKKIEPKGRYIIASIDCNECKKKSYVTLNHVEFISEK